MPMIDRFADKYFFLSNFFRHAVCGAHGQVYPTAEAAFHGGKTDDPALRAWVAAAPTPRIAKARGRKVPLRPDWNDHRHVVMRAVLTTKFSDPVLADRLLGTGDAVLVEGNTWHDQFWGCCRCGRTACRAPGQNWLGRYLMAVRQELVAVRAEASPPTVAA